MNQIIHYAIELDTFGGEFKGNKCVGLEIMDKDLNRMDCYPIPLDNETINKFRRHLS